MKKLIPTLALAVAIASAAVTLMIQRRANATLRENDAVLQQRNSRLSELASEQERLTDLIAQGNKASPKDITAELASLRGSAEALRKQSNELSIQLAQKRRPESSPTASASSPKPPEYYERLHQAAGSKGWDARNLAQAILLHAHEHEGRFPSSLDQVDPYLRQQQLSLSGTNEFEIVFQGSLDDLKKIPQGSVAVVRDRQAWRAPSGKMAKVYGMANGAGQIVESDDDFQSWEAEHILRSRVPGR